jgi:hypothetical protein
MHRLAQFAARVGSASPVSAEPLERAAAELFQAFAEAQVEALLLKGPALARLLYELGETRTYADVDLLVDPSHWAEAQACLVQLGYRNASEVLGVEDVGGVVHDESWVRTGDRRCDESLVELHRWLPGVRAAPERAWAPLVRDSVWLEVAGGRVRTMGRSGQALHLALHAAQHGPEFAKGLRELELALERWDLQTWQRASRLATEIDAAAAFVVGLRFVAPGRGLAETLGLEAPADLEWAIRHRHLRPRGTFHLDALVTGRGWRQRTAALRTILVPNPSWIGVEFPWARGRRSRLPVAYVLHAARLPLWGLRSWSYRRRAQREARRG